MKTGVRDFFDSHVDDYDALHYGTRSLMSERLILMIETMRKLPLPERATILDAGCGPGRFAAAMAERGHEVCGLDLSPSMLRSASGRLEELGGEPPLGFCSGSVEALPFADGTFDAVCSAGVLEYLTCDDYAVEEFKRVLRPGGYLMLPTTNSWSPAGYLDFAVEYLKRREGLLRAFNKIWEKRGNTPVLPRHFVVRRQRPSEIRSLLEKSGFQLEHEIYFYFMPWPHPFDRLLPGPTEWLGRRMERLRESPLGPLGEGYLIVSSKAG